MPWYDIELRGRWRDDDTEAEWSGELWARDIPHAASKLDTKEYADVPRPDYMVELTMTFREKEEKTDW